MKKIECIKRLDAIQGKGRLDSDLASKISPEASTMRQILLFKKSQLEGQLEFCMTKLDLEGRRKNTSKLLGIYNTAKRLRKVIRGTAIALEKSSATLDAARTKLGVAKKPETALGRNRFGLSEEDRYCDDLLPPKCESHYKEDFLKRMKLQLMFKESKIVTQIIKNEPNQSVSNTLASVAMKMSAATSDSAAKSNQIEKPSNSVIETQHINVSEPINKIPGWKCKICTNTNNSKSQTCSICGMALNPPVDSIPNKGRSVSLPLKQNPTPIKVAALQSVSVPLASMPPKASDFEIETPAATSTSKRESVEKLLPSPKVKPSKPDATEHKSKSETMSQEPSKPDATAHKAKSETKSPVPSISDAKDQESKLETKSQESKTEEKTETFSFKGFGTTLKESKTNLESGKSTAITVPQTLHTVPNAVDSKSVDDDMQDDGVPIAADNGPPAPGKPSSTSGPFESTTAVSTSNPWGNPATQLSSAFGAQNATSTSSATQSVTTSAFGMQSAPSNSFGAASNIGQSTAATGWGTSAATSQTSSPWGKTSLFGTSGVASAFGSQSASTSLGNQQAVSAFGTKTNSSFSTPPSATKASAFGNQQVSSAFGTQSSVASAFGTPTTTSAFATNPGSSSTPAFGASAFGTQSSASAFGTQSTTSAFGGSSSTPAWGKKDNPFGGGTQ